MPTPTTETPPPEPKGKPTTPEIRTATAKEAKIPSLTPEQEKKIQTAFEQAKQKQSSEPLVDYFKTLGHGLRQTAEARLKDLEDNYRKEHPSKSQS